MNQILLDCLNERMNLLKIPNPYSLYCQDVNRHKDLKFIKISERKNYYDDGEDAILMQYKN